MSAATTLTSHNGRANAKTGYTYSADHLDKHRDDILNNRCQEDTHIDAERIHQNINVVWDMSDLDDQYFRYTEPGEYIRQNEVEIYNTLYSKKNEMQNERYTQKGQLGYIKSVEEKYYNSKQYCPMETIYQIGNADNPYTDIEKFSQMCFQYANSYNCKNLNNSAIISYSIHADETSLHCHMRRIFYVEDEKDQGALVPSQDKALKEMGYELKDPSKAKSQKNNRLQPYTAYERTRFMDIAERIDPTLTINREAKSASHEHLEKLEYQNQQEQIRLEQNRAEAKRHNKNAKRLDELNKQMEAKLNKNQGIIRQQETQYNKLVNDYNTLVDEHDELKATCEDLEDERERLERAYRKYEGSLDDKLASVQRAANYETLEKFMGKEQLQEVVDNAKRKLKQISHQRNQQHNNDFHER